MADTLISKDPGITVNLLNLSGFLKSDSNFVNSSSDILVGSWRYKAWNSEVVSNSLEYNLKIKQNYVNLVKIHVADVQKSANFHL